MKLMANDITVSAGTSECIAIRRNVRRRPSGVAELTGVMVCNLHSSTPLAEQVQDQIDLLGIGGVVVLGAWESGFGVVTARVTHTTRLVEFFNQNEDAALNGIPAKDVTSLGIHSGLFSGDTPSRETPESVAANVPTMVRFIPRTYPEWEKSREDDYFEVSPKIHTF